MSSLTITDSEIDEAFQITSSIIDEFGPRLPGSDNVHKAEDKLLASMSEFCDTAYKEEFTFAPKAFMGFFDWIAITLIIAIIFMFIGGSWIYGAAIVSMVGVVCALSQFVYYVGYFDIFYKKKQDANIIGIIEPDNPADIKQEIIISGHHDSAQTVTYFLHHQKFYAPRIITGIVTAVVVGFLSTIWAIYYAISGNDIFYATFLKVIAIIGAPFTINLMFYASKKSASPGAGDNLISSAMAIVIGKMIANAKKQGNNPLQHTRLKVISFGAEEAATKGSQDYAKIHKDEFSKLPIYALCPDSIYKMKDFKFLSSDQNGMIKTSKAMIEEGLQIAHDLGYDPAVAPMPFGGGATDAAPLERAGIPSLTIMGMDAEIIREGLVQHTPDDVPEFIEREIIEASMKIMLKYILKKDQKI
jgi:aminopeptidase YwaD